MFRKATALLLAGLLLALSVASASASGLFSEMTKTEYSDERLAVLDEVAETISASRTDGSVTVEVSQAYYEGNRVFISYRANARILEQVHVPVQHLRHQRRAGLPTGGNTP